MESSWDKALDSDYPTDGMHFFYDLITYLLDKLSAKFFFKEGTTP